MFKRQPSPKTWRALPRRNKIGVALLTFVQLGLLVAALWDLRHRPPEAVRGNKRLWTLFVFVNFVGPIAYFWKGRKPLPADRLVEPA